MTPPPRPAPADDAIGDAARAIAARRPGGASSVRPRAGRTRPVAQPGKRAPRRRACLKRFVSMRPAAAEAPMLPMPEAGLGARRYAGRQRPPHFGAAHARDFHVAPCRNGRSGILLHDAACQPPPRAYSTARRNSVVSRRKTRVAAILLYRARFFCVITMPPLIAYVMGRYRRRYTHVLLSPPSKGQHSLSQKCAIDMTGQWKELEFCGTLRGAQSSAPRVV